MLRIRRITDPNLPWQRSVVAQVQRMLHERFPAARPGEGASLPQALVDPFAMGLRSILYVAERRPGVVAGFAWIYHDPALRFVYLDYLAAALNAGTGGLGDALYGAVRESAKVMGAHALYMECLPDDPALVDEPALLPENRARLRFYERFGARPLEGTAYEASLGAAPDGSPYLVIDPLDGPLPSRDQVRGVVRAVLERKYAWLCGPEYVERIVASINSDPVSVRARRYTSQARPPAPPPPVDEFEAPRFVLVTTDAHEIHHVRERGYVESPVRVRRIHDALVRLPLFEERAPRHFAEKHLTAVHDPHYVRVFKAACNRLQPGKPVYPYVFPLRNRTRPPVDMEVRAGYYCMDTFTPLTWNAYIAARRAVDCALTAAAAVVAGAPLAYALVRPPGHHAERGFYGGFCYFGNAAVAAHWLSQRGRVAMLDIDYHHGNGQQDIFYDRADVLTVSIHGHPRFAYPYFAGFPDERGEGEGRGFNLNLALPEQLDGVGYLKALDRALRRVKRHRADWLVVCLGLDTAGGDPTGTWALKTEDFAAIGARIGALGMPTVVVQEGGYDVRAIGRNAASFFTGVAEGLAHAPPAK